MMANPTVRPVSYKPRPRSAMTANDPNYMDKELASISESIESLRLFVPQEATTEPKKSLPGMIRRSVGPWRPVTGQTEDRWVQFTTAGWVYFP